MRGQGRPWSWRGRSQALLRRVSCAEESGPEKNMEVLGGSLAGRDVAIMINTEPRLCADTRDMLHPSLHLILTITLLPFCNIKKQWLRHFFQLVKEPGSHPDSLDSRTYLPNHI